jgi:RHS repeat-associated protein
MNKTLKRFLLLFAVLGLSLLLAALAFPCGGGTYNPDGGGPGCQGGSDGGDCGFGSCNGDGSPVFVIATYTGNLMISDTPVWYRSVGDGFKFTMQFNADSIRTGPMGDRWTHTYGMKVINDAPYGAIVLDVNGWEHYFSGNPTSYPYEYTEEADVRDTLRKKYVSGNWVGWELIRPDKELLTFNTSGQLTARTDAQGFSWTFSYSSGLLSTATDPLSRQTSFTYTSGYLTRVTVPGGAHADFTYDTSTPKKLITATDAGGYQYTYTYTGTRIVSITDPTGRCTEFTYDANGKVTSRFITGLSSSAVTYSYTPQGNGQLYVDITQTKDGANRVTRHIHENTDDPGAGRYKGVLLSVVKDVGGIAATRAWAYDSSYRVIRARDSYAPETGGKDHVARYYYTDSNNPDQITKKIDPENYDSGQGDNSPGYVYTYNSYGQKLTERTPASVAGEVRGTDYGYTLNGGVSQLTSVTVKDEDVNGNAADHTTYYTYYPYNYSQVSARYQLQTMTDARGNVTTYYYDSNGYPDYTDPPLGNNIDYTYNAVGDVTSVTDGNGNTTSYAYDNLHRLTTTTFPSIGAGTKTKVTAYTCCGVDTETDENGVVTKYEYDQYTKRLKKVTQDYGTGKLNYVTEYTYDEVGNLKTEKNARLKTTTYVYDDCDRKIQVDYPDSTHEYWTYRDDGRVWTHTDGRGRTITYRYDADDRLAGSGSYVAINYPNDTDVRITRDKDGLTTITSDASGTTTNEYYPSGWLKRVTTESDITKIITYQYNGVGLVSNMQVSGESSFTYSYNARNQLDTLTNPNSVQISFSYDSGGRRTDITDPSSYVHYAYNARNWITGVYNRQSDPQHPYPSGTTRYDATYYYQDGSLWDHTGNPVKRVENLAGSTYTTTLRYDAVYRQTEETKRDSGNNVIYSLTYGYDAVGNRTTRTLAGTTITYVYDNNNKLSSIGVVPPNYTDLAAFTYDYNGNMLTVSGTMFDPKTMVYNDDNRMTQITYNNGNTTDYYYYKYTGLRYRARLAGTYYRYLYNGQRVLEELNDSGTMTARYTTENGSYYGSLLHLYRPSGTLSRFPMYDNTGTARGLLDASGTATDWYELDTFGRQVSSTGTTPNPYRFGGAWGYITDPSGLEQLGQRFYWPELGRFVSADPLKAINLYAYAANSPMTHIDPAGTRHFTVPITFDCLKLGDLELDIDTSGCKYPTLEGWSMNAFTYVGITVWGLNLGLGSNNFDVYLKKVDWVCDKCPGKKQKCVGVVVKSTATVLFISVGESQTVLYVCADDCCK